MPINKFKFSIKTDYANVISNTGSSPFTAPSDGFATGNKYSRNTTVKVNDITVMPYYDYSNSQSFFSLFLSKGDVLTGISGLVFTPIYIYIYIYIYIRRLKDLLGSLKSMLYRRCAIA